MRDSIIALEGAIKKFKNGEEGDYKQALILADHATETIMRACLLFKHQENPPYHYMDLLKTTAKKEKFNSDITKTIYTFRYLRDGFHHHNIEKLKKGLKGSTTGLTLEKSQIEEYLIAVCQLFKTITDEDMTLDSNEGEE